MSYGHSDKIAKSAATPADTVAAAAGPKQRTTAEPGDTPTPPVSPEWYARPELHPVLTGHDIGALFRALGAIGVSQRQIARLTGRSQPNISEIIHGRQVMSYPVLVAITAGLGVPPERMGLSWWGPDGTWCGPEGAYSGGATAAANAPKGVNPAMLRRHLIALGGAIMAGTPVTNLGKLLDDLGILDPAPLPSQLSQADVVKVRDMTRRLSDAERAYGSDPQVDSAAAAAATRLLDVPGAEPVTRDLKAAVAERHLLAGWSAFEAGLYRNALHHYAQALELATKAGDAYWQAFALNHAGLAAIEHGHPDDGLKMLQCGQVAAWSMPSDHPRRTAVEACGLMDSAMALAALGNPQEAYRLMRTARDLWTPTPADRNGDLDFVPALLEIDRGRLDLAEQFATSSVQRWEGNSRRARTNSGIVLATIYVKAGEQRGLQLAHDAITSATKLTSVRVRRQLTPLAEALQARPQSDAQELARMARQAAA